MKKKLDAAAATAFAKVNPSDPENIAHQAVDKVIKKATGNNVDTLGTHVWNIFHHEDGTAKAPWTKQKKLEF